MLERYSHGLVPQGVSAEMIAEKWAVSRERLDSIAFDSHSRAAAATTEGHFETQIIPVEAGGETVTRDEGIRENTSMEALAALKPAFKADGKITAGNSSQISDGAAAVLLMSAERAEALGLRPRARVVDTCLVGVDPVLMLTGPIDATQRLFERTGLSAGDIDVAEINEAFASVVLAWQKELGFTPEQTNPNGGAIALGHPLGGTGAVLLTKALHELERTGGRYGLVSMCCGGGLGTGTIIERL
jgi:acetyl-CoA acetyltransferase family protein